MKNDLIFYLLLFAFGVAMYYVGNHLVKTMDASSAKTAQKIALSIIQHVGFALVTDAERQYGAGTGELKMSACITKLIELLPEKIVRVLPEDFLKKQLEAILTTAKEKWNKNPRLLE